MKTTPITLEALYTEGKRQLDGSMRWEAEWTWPEDQPIATPFFVHANQVDEIPWPIEILDYDQLYGQYIAIRKDTNWFLRAWFKIQHNLKQRWRWINYRLIVTCLLWADKPLPPGQRVSWDLVWKRK